MAKVMVSLPSELLAGIDSEVKRRQTSRSAFLAELASKELARRRPDLVAAAIVRSERRFQRSGSFESTSLVRDDRDDRDSHR